MADRPEDKNKKTDLSEEQIERLRSTLHKAIDSVDPKFWNILGSSEFEPPSAGGVDVTVCGSKCF